MFIKEFVNHSVGQYPGLLLFLQGNFHQRELRRHALPREDLHDGDPPVDSGIVACRIEERQGHQGDGRSDGQGPNEAHEKANEA